MEWLFSAAAGLVGGGIAYGMLVGRVTSAEKDIIRIEAAKATKESVAGLERWAEALKDEMDKRFDRLEGLILGRNQ